MHGEIVGLAAVMGIFVIPSLAILGRFVIRPIVDSVLRARQLERGAPVPDDGRVARLEERMAEMQEEMAQLREIVDFHMQLQAGVARTGRLHAGAGIRGSLTSDIPA